MNEILKRLDLIGEKLGEGVAFSWETFVRQAFLVDGVWGLISNLIVASLACGGLLLTVKLWAKGREADNEGDYQSDLLYTIGGVLVGLAAVVLFPVAIVGAINSISHLINPQYYALTDLAKLVGK